MKSAGSFAVTSPEVLPPGSWVQAPAMHILSKGKAILKREQNLQVQ